MQGKANMEPTVPPPIPPSSPPTPPPTPAAPRNWWQRNWKWFVPTGCLTLFVGAIVFIAAIVLLVFGAIKSSDAYKTAVSRVKADSRVTEAIGTPIKEGWVVGGHTEVSGGSGQADLTIPIHGPKGEATIYTTATKSAGR
jgi:Cytochrome oxidase complex assembly protein 1